VLRRTLVLLSSTCFVLLSIEIIENYPTNEVEVDSKRLEGVYRQLRRLQTNKRTRFT
jgi:hypothetical protein